MRTMRRGAAAVAMVPIAACATRHATTSADVEPRTAGTTETARVLPLEHIADPGHYGSPLRSVVTDSVTLRRVWSLAQGSGTASPPYVDFTRKMVILVALGAQPTTGWGIRVDSVATTGDAAATAFVSIAVPEGCIEGQAFTLPMDAVVVQRPGRGNLLVSFAERVRLRDCAPFRYDDRDRTRLKQLSDSLAHRSRDASRPE